MSTKNRRKFRFLFPEAGGQLRFLAPILILFGFNFIVLQVLSWQFAGRVTEWMNAPRVHGVNMPELQALSFRIALIALIGTVGSGVLCLLFCLHVSARTFGPLIAIRNYIERLTKGDYEGELKLRKHDQFVPIADGLNLLTQTLRNSSPVANERWKVQRDEGGAAE